jgi:hypothetical protein
LLAEMVMRTYHEVQDKPIYVIRETLESPEEEAQKMKGANPTTEGRTS